MRTHRTTQKHQYRNYVHILTVASAITFLLPLGPAGSTELQPPVGTPRPVVGFSPGAGILWESDADLDRDLDSMVASGASWVRLDFPWSVLEPRPGVYDWSLTDRAVDAVLSHGMQVLSVAGYTPDWARPTGADSDKFAPRDPQAFASFLTASARRYQTKVHVWEIWNEPNVTPFWRPKPNATSYTALLKPAYLAIKRVDPTAIVLVGGLSPATDAPDGSEVSPATFVSQLYEAGAKGYFDAIAVHPYSFPARPMDPSTSSWNTFIRLPIIYDIMVKWGDSDKKVWLTEFGAPTGTSASAVSEATQAAILDDALAAVAQWPWVGPLMWFSVRDAGTNARDTGQNFGLLRRDFSPKPAMETLKRALRTQPTTTTTGPTTSTTKAPTTSTTKAPTTTTSTTVTPPSLTVSNIAVSRVTATSAVITWTTSAPASSEVKLRLSNRNSKWRGADEVISHSVTLDGLLPASRYSFKVRSRTTAGAQVAGKVFYFDTPRL